MQIGGDSQNTTPIAINAGLTARQAVQAAATDPTVPKAASWGDVFSKQGLENVKTQFTANQPLVDALQQQSFFTRLARKLPFIGPRLTNALGPQTSTLNDAIAKLGKAELNGTNKATVTRIVMQGGDVAGNLTKAGLDPALANQIAEQGSAAAAEQAARSTVTAAATTATTAAASGLGSDGVSSLLNASKNGGMLAGKNVSVDAIQKVLASNPKEPITALRQLGLRADAAKSIASAAAKTGEVSAKSVAADAGEQVAKKSGGFLSGLFNKIPGHGLLGKLFSGAKGNFVIAGIFSIGSNAIQLATGKMNLKQFLGLSAMDTAAYGGIGMGAAAAGAAIGSVVPVFGTAIGFVAGLGIGLLGGSIYEKFIRKPVKKLLGGSAPQGGAAPVAPGEYQDPYHAQAPQGGAPQAQAPAAQAPAAQAGGMSYDQALAMLNGPQQ